jgi:drug/metabolite transporter (DMT)-like permease
MQTSTAARTAILTALSLIAFAANSVLCRLALADARIDAASFTAVRLASGALVLGLIALPGLRALPWPGSVGSTAALFLYAAPFSYAYLRLGAGVGALVLFACVQVTMIGWGLFRGERSSALVWLGLAIAMVGLIGLTSPGSAAPDLLGAGLMAIAGVAWGAYSLRGRSASAPALETTAANFVGTVPAAALLILLERESLHLGRSGLVIALVSGALASGVGYIIWYSALRTLPATRAAILQLLVPILAAAAGVVMLGEALTVRLVVAGAVIILGVAVALSARTRIAAGSTR